MYHQIPLVSSSQKITAFLVPGKSHYHFTQMSYGLTEAPVTFQRLLDHLIGLEIESYAFAYFDDIMVVTQTFEEYLDRYS